MARPADFDKYVNIEEGLGRVMNNKKIYNKLLTKFMDKTYIEPLTDQIKAGDMDGAKFSVHTIKGLAANLSLPVLFEASLDYEGKVKAGTADAAGLANLTTIHTKTMECIKELLAEG